MPSEQVSLTRRPTTGYSNSAEDIHFSIEGGDNVPILRARLFNLGGEAIDADCNLSERIGNDNGNFVFSEYFLPRPAGTNMMNGTIADAGMIQTKRMTMMTMSRGRWGKACCAAA